MEAEGLIKHKRVDSDEADDRLHVEANQLRHPKIVENGCASPSKSHASAQAHAPSAKRLIFCSLGIFVCYFYYGIVQEKITRSKYGEDKEPFTYTQSLVFVQCVVNAGFSLFAIFLTQPGFDDTPSATYAALSFTYLAAMVSSNHALQFLSYPTQVLGKSCKPIPIMIMGVLFARKRYPIAKYGFVLMIVVGVALFLFKDSKAKASGGTSATQMGWGEVLLVFSLLMDGSTGAIQERIRANHSSKSHHMMLNMNLWSMLYLLVGLVVTGEILTFFMFVQKYHFILWDMISFSFASAIGQYFIFVTVTEFGPLTCSIVTTTRKFFTILASVLYFQNPMTARQWTGTLLVFVGLALDGIYGKPRKPKN